METHAGKSKAKSIAKDTPEKKEGGERKGSAEHWNKSPLPQRKIPLLNKKGGEEAKQRKKEGLAKKLPGGKGRENLESNGGAGNTGSPREKSGKEN